MIRTADAQWNGDLLKGNGTMRLGSGAFEGKYSFPSRFESGQGTNPEELIAAAHAGCFSMAFAATLAKEGFQPQSVNTTAKVHLEKVDAGFEITTIELVMEATVPNIEDARFQELADVAKRTCPVSKALAGPNITLQARLLSPVA
jgi:osmotically inducible protein OsmC